MGEGAIGKKRGGRRGTGISVADPDPFDTDTDPVFNFDTDPDPAFQSETNPDQTIWYGSGSLPFQRGNTPKTVLFIHLYL
jgi:hypothetical protein